MNHAVEVLEREERELEYQLKCQGWSACLDNDLKQTQQAITDLKELEAQRQMRREAGG